MAIPNLQQCACVYRILTISSDQHHSQLSSVPTRLLTPVLVSNPNPVVRGCLVPPTLLHYTASTSSLQSPLLLYLQYSNTNATLLQLTESVTFILSCLYLFTSVAMAYLHCYLHLCIYFSEVG